MRYATRTAVCLAVMLAFGAVIAAGASAHLPEVGKCIETAGGRYENAACTAIARVPRRVNGHYEWTPGSVDFAAQFEGNNHGFYSRGSVGPTTLETTSGQKIACADTESAYGEQAEVAFEVKPPSAVSGVLVSFTNCKEADGEERECYSSGYGNEGEGEGGTITDVNLWYEEETPTGELEIVAGKGTAEPTVGLVLHAFEPKSEDNERKRLLTAQCEGALNTVWIGGETKAKNGKGTIISLVSPVDQPTQSLTVNFRQTAGVQEPDATEGGAPRFLEAFVHSGFERLGVASTWEVFKGGHGGLPVEIKAIR